MDEEREGIHWNEQLERIMSNEGERALCYFWLHNHAQKTFSRLDTCIALPVIVLSTVAGTGSIASESLFKGSPVANVVIGSISLGVGILNTVSNYFGWAKRSEGHKIAAMTYSKLYKFIVIELSLPRKERMAAGDMLKIIREQTERLSETSPQVPDDAIKAFNKRFEDSTPDISKPEITNGLDPILVYGEFHPEKESSIRSTPTPKKSTVASYTGKPPEEVKITIAHDATGIPQKTVVI
jgi:hypothetical protein